MTDTDVAVAVQAMQAQYDQGDLCKHLGRGVQDWL